jgi:hypothetical protein
MLLGGSYQRLCSDASKKQLCMALACLPLKALLPWMGLFPSTDQVPMQTPASCCSDMTRFICHACSYASG